MKHYQTMQSEKKPKKTHKSKSPKSFNRMSGHRNGLSIDEFKSLKTEEEINHLFCKKYSRIKMSDNIWKRIDFELYKKLTKEERLEIIKSTVSPKKKTTKKK